MSVSIDYTGGVFQANRAKKVGTVTAGTGPYNLASASYDSVSFSVGTQETLPTGLTFSTDGTNAYIVGNSQDKVFQYTLSTAWDLSTASYASKSLSVGGQASLPDAIAFKYDGTSLYVLDRNTDDVFQYDLTTAWDVSTASYASKSMDASSEDTSPRGIHFKPDGTKVYIAGDTNNSIYQYALSTAWDISTGSFETGKSFSVNTQTTYPCGVYINSNGDKMWVASTTDGYIYQYSLSTAWDVSTASYDSVSFDASTQVVTGLHDLYFKSDGSKMYLLSLNTDIIYQYSTRTATTLDLSTGNYFSHTPSVNTVFAFSNPPASGTAAGFALALTGANVAEVYDIANASYDSVSFSVSTQEGLPSGLFFKPDGSKMYVSGYSNDVVAEYDLSTSWDVSTAVVNQTTSISAQEGVSMDLFFKPDGTKMYIVGQDTDSVYEYDLSTAWDISTKTYNSSFLAVGSQENTPRAMFFKPDGTKMYIAGTQNDTVYQYALSTAWDVSSGSFETGKTFSVASQETQPQGLFFSPDGTTMFVSGTTTDSVYKYTLSTAWDVSTASYASESFNLSSENTAIDSIFFKSDGSKMYALGLVGDTVYQYTTGSTSAATFTYPSSVKFPSGTAPAGPAIGETDVLVFYTDDGGTTYQGFRAGNAMA